MPTGLGSQPFGSSPYGIGTPAVAEDLGGKVLTDSVTGKQTGSRKIDSRTKDYVIDATGRIEGMPNVQQLVLLAISTEKGSSAMRQLGQDLRRIERITAAFARRVDSSLRSAVQHLVDRGLIQVVGTQVEILKPGGAWAHLQWRDLSAKDPTNILTTSV